jgi:hypothetical protein
MKDKDKDKDKDNEKIEKVEIALDGGHTKPPHSLWYLGEGKFDPSKYYKAPYSYHSTLCKNDSWHDTFALSDDGICEKCFNRLNEDKKGR